MEETQDGGVGGFPWVRMEVWLWWDGGSPGLGSSGSLEMAKGRIFLKSPRSEGASLRTRWSLMSLRDKVWA